jgi:hypothetical protein
MMNMIKNNMATYNCHTTMMMTLPTQNETMTRKEKKLCATTTAPPFYLHKMKPRIKRKNIMGTYQSVIATPQ